MPDLHKDNKKDDMKDIIEGQDPRKQRDQSNADLAEAYKNHFIIKNKQNLALKSVFFKFVLLLVVIMVLVLATIAIIIVASGIKNYSDVGVIISALASALTTIIVLPLIIGNYLFKKDEDDKLLEYMIRNQANDKKHQLDEMRLKLESANKTAPKSQEDIHSFVSGAADDFDEIEEEEKNKRATEKQSKVDRDNKE